MVYPRKFAKPASKVSPRRTLFAASVKEMIRCFETYWRIKPFQIPPFKLNKSPTSNRSSTSNRNTMTSTTILSTTTMTTHHITSQGKNANWENYEWRAAICATNAANHFTKRQDWWGIWKSMWRWRKNRRTRAKFAKRHSWNYRDWRGTWRSTTPRRNPSSAAAVCSGSREKAYY